MFWHFFLVNTNDKICQSNIKHENMYTGVHELKNALNVSKNMI